MSSKRLSQLALSVVLLLLTAQFLLRAAGFGSMPPTIDSFSASPATITTGKSTTLRWTTSHATSLSISGLGPVTGTSISISPAVTTVYTLTASNANANVTKTLTITVNNPRGGSITPPPQAGRFTTLDFDDEFTTLHLAPGANNAGYVWHKGIWYRSTLPDASLITNPAGVLDLAWNRNVSTSRSNPTLTQIMTISHDGRTTARTWRYGYFEARMRWDVAAGMWPAFWLNPIHEVLGQGGLHGEIDIFEGQGSDPGRYYGTLHNWNGNTQTASQRPSPNYANLPGVDFSQWHKYGMLWTPGQIQWYFDDALIESASTFANMDAEKYYLLLSLNFGNNWNEGNLSGVTINSGHLQVDWVRVWQ